MPKRREGAGSDHIPLHGSGVYGRPRDVEGGLVAKSKRGKFGESWWADRWIGVLEGFGWGSRLERGRAYARRGQTLSLNVEPGKVTAKVQGSRIQPYDVTISYPQLSPKTWDKVMDALGQKAVFAAKLLAGEMPHEIEDAFYAAGTWLFPKSEREIGGQCSCPDAVRPCKHLAAVHFMVAEAFDEDPFLLFTLRGRTRDQVVAALRERRVVAAPVEAGTNGATGPGVPTPTKAAPIDEPVVLDPERFFELRAELPHDSVALDPPNPAVTTLGPLKLDGREDVMPVLETIVGRVRDGALKLAFAQSKDASAKDA